ncbi:ATP-binding cassette domain-containing protein [Insolitispirillum peregrinum]|uniref:ATP-binding cassette, subfamily B n=1 Tax=Insolitispirillum peregrinum TaxID=80876 RepID=A0A1N7PCW2_9PROT|nr:ATP-binding cassette domain-containing protein [Insolitispirillum peregrinum]SIT08485.1 ATP-binding cassette, subfamily B [Insolitispirillum peregrinum]
MTAQPPSPKPAAHASQGSKGLEKEAFLSVLRSNDLRRALPYLGTASVLLNILGLALPLALLQIYDRIIANQSLTTLSLLIGGVLVAMLLEETLKYLRGAITGWLGARFEQRASLEAMDRLARTPLRVYLKDEAGNHAERVSASSHVSDFYSGQAILVIFDLPFVVVYLSIIALIGGWLALVPALLLLLFMAIVVKAGAWMRSQVQERNVQDERRYSFLSETLRGIHSVKMLSMEALMHRRYERLQEANAERGAVLAHGGAMAAAMGTVFTQVMMVGVVGAGAVVVIHGDMTPGGMAACVMLSVRSLQPLRRSLAVWLRYQAFVSAYGRLREVMRLPYVKDDDFPPVPPVRQSLELRSVTFDPVGKGNPLFRDLSLSVRAGECIGICGDSGSGKSSLLSLISGAFPPDGGEILVDGRPLTSFRATSLHQEIALLPQKGSVVAGSILDNMTMGDASCTERALGLARHLGLDQVVAGLRLGYDTPVGDGVAETLPAGVRQRLSIIRALARDPSVVLFDEANIALDLMSDKRLKEYLEEQKGKRILILVTPRPSLLSLADRVFTLKDGQLVEGRQSFDSGLQSAIEQVAIPERPQDDEWKPVDSIHHFDEVSDLALCLPPLLSALQWKGRARDLAESLPHLMRHLDLSGLRGVLSNLGYTSESFPATLGRLDGRLTPCLFVPHTQGAKVVLSHDDLSGRLTVFDSDTLSVRTISSDDPACALSGIAYLFREEDEELLADGRRHWTRQLIARFHRHIGIVFALTMLSTLLGLAPSLFVMSVYDRVLPTGDVMMGVVLMVGVLLAVGLDFSVRSLKSRLLAFIAGRAEYILGNSIFQRILDLPSSATDNASIGEQISRIKGFESLRDFFLGPLALLVFDLPATVILFVAMSIINPWAVLVMLLGGLSFVLLGFLTRQRQEEAVNRSSTLSGRRWEMLTETLVNMRTLRSVGATGVWQRRYRDITGKTVLAAFQAQQTGDLVASGAQLLANLTGIAALTVSVIGAIEGWITTGAVVATMMIVWRLTGPMQNIFMASSTVVRVVTSFRQVERLMRMPVERGTGTRQSTRPETRGAVSFARVSFRYSNDADPALLGVSFTVPAGKVVAVAGPNGSGKSTLLKLIVRAFSPQAGVIKLDAVDIRQLSTADLRSQVSYMPQTCELFYGTVAQNLRLSQPTATMDELRWASEMAGLLADIEAMQEGFETRISESKSEQLPHGFRQRLSLARTLLKKAPVVLLDEPGNGLDDEGEKALVRCINWLRGRSSVFIVSHRPSHMRLADAVIYLEAGNIRAIGPFDEIRDKIMAGLG